MLIAGLDPADLPDAIRQLAGLLIAMARNSGHTNDQIGEWFRDVALRQAATEEDQ